MVNRKKLFLLFLVLVIALGIPFKASVVDSSPCCDAIPVLTFHDIGETANSFTVKPQEFEAHIKYLVKEGYTFLVPGDLDLFLSNKKKFPKKSVMITFDDACKGVYTYAYPVLKKYRVRVTLFVICMFLEREGFATFADLDEMVSSGLFFIGSHTYDSHYAYYYPKEKKHLPATIRQVGESKGDYQKRMSNDLSMSLEMLTMMYPHLLINTFSYPYGEYNQELIQLVKESGFHYAFAYDSQKQLCLTRKSNVYALERFPVVPGTPPSKLIK